MQKKGERKKNECEKAQGTRRDELAGEEKKKGGKWKNRGERGREEHVARPAVSLSPWPRL